jgi:hypothetical protein
VKHSCMENRLPIVTMVILGIQCDDVVFSDGGPPPFPTDVKIIETDTLSKAACQILANALEMLSAYLHFLTCDRKMQK